VRPGGAGNLYLRRLSDDQELTIPPADDVVDLARLAFADARVAERGAAHQAFSLIFSLPFDETKLDLLATVPPPAKTTKSTTRKLVLWSLGAASAVGAAVGGVLLWEASRAADEGRRSSQQRAAELNHRIDARNAQATVAFALAGATLTAGALTWFLTRSGHAQNQATSAAKDDDREQNDERYDEGSADRFLDRRAPGGLATSWSIQVGFWPTQLNLSARF
jgi:hypothetical protein